MRAQLIDVSKWNAAWDPLRAEKKIDGVIIRASYGLVPDRLFSTFYSTSLTIPVRGAYHYFSSGVSWLDQVGFFINLVEGKDIHFLALDFERSFNHMSAEFALDAGKWLEEVHKRTKLDVLLYTNASTYDECLAPYSSWMDNWPLWIANYPYRRWNSYLERITSDDSLKPRLPKGRRDWTIWQYSANGNRRGNYYGVESIDVDLNAYNGSVNELHIWANVDQDIEKSTSGNSEADQILDEMQNLIDRYRWK